MSVEVTRLPSGLSVVTDRMPHLETASLGVWIGSGSRNENPDEHGISHLLEHMAFKGTARRTARQIAEQIEDVGGYINAWTSRETTAYYARVLEADVPLAVDLLADIVLNPAFDPREIEVERGVILQEIGQVLDTPDDIIFDWLQQVAYPGQPLGRTILGPEERVADGPTHVLPRMHRWRGEGHEVGVAVGAHHLDRDECQGKRAHRAQR
jgi:predicted Zn-dependent peptidase